ncbi:MAG: reductive dehalogenase [Thermodesulfobacteriota bacterium]
MKTTKTPIKSSAVSSVERFDQKNIMFRRAGWDPECASSGKKFFGQHYPKKQPGYTLEDYALLNSSWYVERRFGHGNELGNTDLFSWECLDGRVNKLAPGQKLDSIDPKVMSERIKKVANLFGASLVGVAELDERWVYSHSYDSITKASKPLELPEECKYVVVIGIEMDYDLVKTSPLAMANATSGLAYSKMPFVAGLVGQFIRLLGYKALPIGNDTALSIPIAIDAGLGELGRNGLLITPSFGPRVRICKVITDLPLVPDPPCEFGVEDFCQKCKKCAEHCPSQAILAEERTASPLNISNNSGALKWPVDAERCFKYWAANGASCCVCIRVCPFNKKPGRIHDLSRFFIEKAPSLNNFFIWLDDALGYGKQARAERFWQR